MEETLTECLVRVREDLHQLKKVRKYLDTVGDTEEPCFVTWRTIEAFNSILSVCSSQNTPETDALGTLLDSFYHLAKNNSDDRVWEDFGFELGIICVKVLSAIERTEIFEILFCKLLSVIGLICQHNSNVWKATARQILNVLINKKVSLLHLEAIFKLYVSVLKNVDGSTLHDFSSQNLHLLKTLSLMVQQMGDFEVQSNVIELIFLHFSKDLKKLFDFLSMGEEKLFLSYTFTNFEHDCRLYLNELNNRRGLDKKVYSICCQVLYFGGHFVEPPEGKDFFWVDANKDTERLTIKCGDAQSREERLIYVNFSDILTLDFKSDKSGGNRCLTIGTTSLVGFHKDDENCGICLVVENVQEVLEFVSFLKGVIRERKGKKKLGGKGSKTIDCLLIDRSSPRKDVQDNAITSSERPGIDQSLPDVLTFFEDKSTLKISPTMPGTEKNTPRTFQEAKVFNESQKLSPNSFAESFNKHIELRSSEKRYSLEDSVETVEFLPKTTSSGHKLFRSPQRIFNFAVINEPKFSFTFGENKENSPGLMVNPNIRTYGRKTRNVKPTEALKDKSNLEAKLSNTQSEDYFQPGSNVLKKKKPSLPKLRRSIKEIKNEEKMIKGKCINTSNETKNGETRNKSESESTKSKESERRLLEEKRKQFKREDERISQEKKNPEKKGKLDIIHKPKKREETIEETSDLKREGQKKQTESLWQRTSNSAGDKKQQAEAKPSLLDPKGYTYKRWCKQTTSERSNFWLKKLNALEKSKTEPDSVFDFSEDSVPNKSKTKKKVIHSKRKCVTKAKPTTLRQVKEILKNSSPTKEKPKTIPQKDERLDISGSPAAQLPQEFDAREDIPDLPQTVHASESYCENAEFESVSEDENEPPHRTIKRERSDEDSSAVRRCAKKKPKTSLPRELLSSLRRRLRKSELKDKQCTDEVIQTMNHAINHTFNHLQRKDGEQATSYLNAAEGISTAFATEIDELGLRAKRIQKAIFYFRAECSVFDFCRSLDVQFSRVRDALKDLREKKNASKTTDQIKNRLTDLIKSEIERTIRYEWEARQKKLFKCASFLGADCKGFA